MYPGRRLLYFSGNSGKKINQVYSELRLLNIEKKEEKVMKMKKVMSLVLALSMALSLTACGGGDAQTTAPAAEPDRKSVV